MIRMMRINWNTEEGRVGDGRRRRRVIGRQHNGKANYEYIPSEAKTQKCMKYCPELCISNFCPQILTFREPTQPVSACDTCQTY